MDTSQPREQELADQIVIDGVAGHLFPIAEAKKIRDVTDRDGQPVTEIPDSVIAAGETPEFFSVRLPSGEEKSFQTLSSEVKKNGFKAIAYREVDENRQPVMDADGKSELRLSFQGLVKGAGDYLTAAKVQVGMDASHVEDVEPFTKDAIDQAGGKDNISTMIFGSHSYGTINAVEAYRVAKEEGVEKVDVVLFEPFGARNAVENTASRMAKTQLEDEGQSTGGHLHNLLHRDDKAALQERTAALMSDLEEHVTTVTNIPLSIVGDRKQASPVGEAYTLDVSKAKEGQSLSGKELHQLKMMMKTVFNGELPQHVGQTSQSVEKPKHPFAGFSGMENAVQGLKGMGTNPPKPEKPSVDIVASLKSSGTDMGSGEKAPHNVTASANPPSRSSQLGR